MSRRLEDGTTLVQLPNGLRVIFAHRAKSSVATLALSIGYGSKFETKHTNGIAHFLEHLSFKGSRAYPDPKDLNVAVARLGGDLTGFTGVESTQYVLQAPDRALSDAIRILSEVIAHPLMREEDVRRERQVVAEEIAGKQDDPNDQLEDLFSQLLFSPHPYSFPVAGRPSLIRTFTADQLRRAHMVRYRPNNMVLTVVSDQPARALLPLLEETFGVMQPLRKATTLLRTPRARRARISIETMDGAQSYLALGGLSPAWGDRDRTAFDIALAALAGDLHARLPVLLRETLGEVYDIQAVSEPLLEAGSFGIYTDCAPTHAGKVLTQMVEQLRGLRVRPLTDDEIDVAARLLEGTMLVSDDDQAELGEYYSTRLLVHGRFELPATYAKRWRTVRPSAVRAAAAKYFDPTRLRLAALASRRAAAMLRSAFTA